MRTLCLKYFRHINQIIQIMQPGLSPKSRYSKSQFHMQKNQGLQSEQQLQEQLESLKENIQNLLKNCNRLENENKILKSGVPSSIQILEQNSYVIGLNDYSPENGDILSRLDTKIRDNFQMIHRQKQQLNNYKLELKKTRELYLDSLNKIQQLKNEISNLRNMISRNFQPLDKISQSNSTILNCQIEHETLLCDQDLNIDDSFMKENCCHRANKDQTIVGSLISKGISFRQQRTLRSDEFKHLSTIVEKYRQESMSHSKELTNTRNNKSFYR